MIGVLEVVIVLAILLVIFGARYAPALGRSAGKGIRFGRKKGAEVATKVTSRAEGYDPKQLARTAGEHVREARELRDEFTGGAKDDAADEGAPEDAAADREQKPQRTEKPS